MIIRQALKDDLNDICVLSNEIYGEHFESMPDTFLQPEGDNRDTPYWQCFIEDPEGIVLLVEENNETIGVASGKIVVTKGIPFLAEKTRLYIGTMVVSEKYRRQGIASLLMAHLEEFALGFNATEVMLEVMHFNQGAETFYRELGFDDFSTKLVKAL